MDKLEAFLDEELKFDLCKSFKDAPSNSATLYDTINKELEFLLNAVSTVGDGN
jgi:hypothetical protein